MEHINLFMSPFGKVSAIVMTEYMGLVTVVLGLLALLIITRGFYRRDKLCLYLSLVLGSILLTLIPFSFGRPEFNSFLLWGCVVFAGILGFIYYFLDIDLAIASERSVPQESRPGFRHLMREIIQGRGLGRTPKEFFLKKFVVILGGLIGSLVIYLRVFQIELYPGGYSFWELDLPLKFIKFDLGQEGFKDYLGFFGKLVGLASDSPILVGMAFPFFKIFGISLVTARYFSFFLGLLGLFFFYRFLRFHFSFIASFLMVSLVSLDLVLVTFSRTGFQNISSFTYAAFLLFMLEVSFKPRKPVPGVLFGIIFGLLTFGTLYMYITTRAMMLAAVVILGWRCLFKKGFLSTHWPALAAFSITLPIVILVYTQGQLVRLWPDYGGYLSIKESSSAAAFIGKGAHTLIDNINPVINRIAFAERALDSTSPYSEGGLVTGPILALLPFGIGFFLGGLRNERYFIVLVVSIIALLPAILAGVPNARRMLMFIPFLLIMSGFSLFIIYDLIRRIFKTEGADWALIFPGFFLLYIFSYNLFVFLDVNRNMRKENSVLMPFADSGFLDIRFSSLATRLAKNIKEIIKEHDVYYYYSNIFDENLTAPNGVKEQFMIESYENSKNGGGRLMWLNPYYVGYRPLREWDRLHFHSAEEARELILESQRDVKVLFFKPLEDEKAILESLKRDFPGSRSVRGIGDDPGDDFYLLDLPMEVIRNIRRGIPPPPVEPGEELFSELTINRLFDKNPKEGIDYDGTFFIEKETRLRFKQIPGLMNIEIDEKPLRKEVEDVFLSPGNHRIRVRSASDPKPLSISEVGKPSKAFSAPLVAAGETGLRDSHPFVFYPYRWVLEESIPAHPSAWNPSAIYFEDENRYFYSIYGQLLGPTGEALIEKEISTINGILAHDGKVYVSRFNDMNQGILAVYDSGLRKTGQIPINGYPFRLFIGNAGEVYVTSLNLRVITVVLPDGRIEAWDTSAFSGFPIWEGDVDRNGDFILLSADRRVFILDSNKKVLRDFAVNAAWNFTMDALRTGGNLAVLDGIIHLLNPWDKKIYSYDKNGGALFNGGDGSLVELQANYQPLFLQNWKGKIMVFESNGPPWISIFRKEKRPFSGGKGLGTSLLRLRPEGYEVGWGEKPSFNEIGLLKGTIDGEQYHDFIFAHGPSRINFRLNRMYNTLSFGIGLDDVGGRDGGSVVFIVKGDGRPLFTSKTVLSMQGINRHEVDISGVNILELIVDSTPDGMASDEAIWVKPWLTSR